MSRAIKRTVNLCAFPNQRLASDFISFMAVLEPSNDIFCKCFIKY